MSHDQLEVMLEASKMSVQQDLKGWRDFYSCLQVQQLTSTQAQ